MEKNQKILVAVLAIVIVLAVVIFAIAMNKNTNEEVSSTNEVTSEVVSTEESTEVESSTEVIASIGTAPEDSTSSVDKSDAINFPGSETTESSTSESATDSSNTESSTSKTESATESTTSSASKTETSASSTSESSTSETSTSVTSTSAEPTTSESSTTPSTPVDNSSSTPSTPAGEQITQGSTGTTSLGTTYPIVSEFNKVGLNPDSVSFGSVDGSSNDFAVAFGQGNRAISDVLGYPSTQIAINVTSTYISYGDAYITRNPEKGYYTFSYTYDLREESDGGASSRAAHQVMLGAITSTPVEVENAMYNDCFVNPTMDGWVTIGDCQVRFSYADDTCTVYKIKPLN